MCFGWVGSVGAAFFVGYGGLCCCLRRLILRFAAAYFVGSGALFSGLRRLMLYKKIVHSNFPEKNKCAIELSGARNSGLFEDSF